ncbi:MAG TPA: flagellar basal body P-ring formation protein FlgA, partial [Gammaproteobacteria bacterium]|nr:flagellar basal body P-ring formation protein FlgA [Gammaproteobacteria bacterium]
KGKFAQRSIQGGVVLTPKMLFIPNLVDKGDQVTILFQQGDLKVQMKGVAMENGYRDGKIRVKNSSSGKMVEGVVTAPGRVLVTN